MKIYAEAWDLRMTPARDPKQRGIRSISGLGHLGVASGRVSGGGILERDLGEGSGERDLGEGYGRGISESDLGEGSGRGRVLLATSTTTSKQSPPAPPNHKNTLSIQLIITSNPSHHLISRLI